MNHLQPDNIVHGERQRRKQTGPVACPVCGVTVRPADMEQHYAIEVERLHKLHISDVGHRAKSTAAAHRSPQGGKHATPTDSSSSSINIGGTTSTAGCSTSALSGTVATGVTTTATGSSSSNITSDGASSSGAGANGAGPLNPKECWTTYQRIKNNRQSRLKVNNCEIRPIKFKNNIKKYHQMKSRKRKSSDPICPVCNEYVSDDINIHVELCLRRSDNGRNKTQPNGNHSNSSLSEAPSTNLALATAMRNNGSNDVADDDDEDDDISIDVESESFEEYEWAGQTRIRASSLLQGGYGAAGVGTCIQQAAAGDEDEDLNVDVDDSHVFGDAQYGERDVILPSAVGTNKEQTETLYLRKLVTGDSGLRASSSGVSSNGTTHENRIDVSETNTPAKTEASTSSDDTLSGDSKDQIIEALKVRLREHESQTRLQNKSKCLICMDEFRLPVVSICCWHVHCEECWLRTLGARKLCPQCNMITSPTDLRRIYM